MSKGEFEVQNFCTWKEELGASTTHLTDFGEQRTKSEAVGMLGILRSGRGWSGLILKRK